MVLDVGKVIRQKRKEQGLSQVQLAKQACISQAALSDIERLNNTPSTYTIKKIAAVLGCTVADLFEEDAQDVVSVDALSPDEHDLIKYYRSMNVEAKTTLLNMARLAAGNPSAQEGLTQKSTIS